MKYEIKNNSNSQIIAAGNYIGTAWTLWKSACAIFNLEITSKDKRTFMKTGHLTIGNLTLNRKDCE